MGSPSVDRDETHVAEIGGIGTAPADQDIGGARALERIVARAAIESAGVPDAAHEDVVAAAAIEEVIAAAALDDVVAVLAVKLVGAGGAGERVVEIRAEHVLDADERIALGRAADPATGRQIDADARRRVAVEHRVDAVTAVEAVGAAEALERIVAVQAIDDVGCRAAIKAVAAVGAVDGRHSSRPSFIEGTKCSGGRLVRRQAGASSATGVPPFCRVRCCATKSLTRRRTGRVLPSL